MSGIKVISRLSLKARTVNKSNKNDSIEGSDETTSSWGVMEKWDTYTQEGVKTGRTVIRGEQLLQGDYHLVVHIWISNSKGDHLIQKRAAHLKSHPNLWAFTGGAVTSGEESLEAAIRETNEELGLSFQDSEFNHIHTISRVDSIIHIWELQVDLDAANVPFDSAEVAAVQWSSCGEIKKMIQTGIFHNYHENYLTLALN